MSITAGPPPPVPTVTGVSPASGPTAGGTVVTISGSGFSGAGAVNFGNAPAQSFTVNSDTSITATTPPGTGTVDVTVSATWGTSATRAADRFTYVVPPPPAPTLAAIDPVAGPAGSLVTLLGTDFTGATAVSFGGIPATFTVNNATTITATAPAGSGTVDVTVTTPAGTSEPGSEDDRVHLSRRSAAGTGPVAGGGRMAAQRLGAARRPRRRRRTSS